MPSANPDVEVHPDSQDGHTSPWIILGIALCTASLVSILIFSAISTTSRAGSSQTGQNSSWCSCFRKNKPAVSSQRYPNAIPAREWIAQRRAAQNVLNASKQSKVLSRHPSSHQDNIPDANSASGIVQSPIHPLHTGPRPTLSTLIQTQQRADGKDRYYPDGIPEDPVNDSADPTNPLHLRPTIRRIGSNIPTGVLEEHVTPTLSSALEAELGPDYREKSAQSTPVGGVSSPDSVQVTVKEVTFEPTHHTVRKALNVSHTTNRPKSTVGSALFGHNRSLHTALNATYGGTPGTLGGVRPASAPGAGNVSAYQPSRKPVLSYAHELTSFGSSHSSGGYLNAPHLQNSQNFGNNKDPFGASNTFMPIGPAAGGARNHYSTQSIADARRTIASMSVLATRTGRDVEVSVQSPLHTSGYLLGSSGNLPSRTTR